MENETVCEIVRRAESNYLQGTTTISKYVNWSMADTVDRIDAYLNSRHISGDTDSLGRDKPFFNIVSAATNIWYRATDIDRKDIKFIPTNSGSVLLAFIANVMLQNWMNDNRFGQFLNLWGRELAKYGSAVSKFVEKDGKLIPTVVPWNRFIADPVDFEALPRIEKFYLTPAQLKKRKGYDQTVVDSLIENRQSSRKTIDGQQKDMMNEFIELYEVHGEMSVATYKLAKDIKPVEGDENIFKQQMHVITFTQAEGKDGYNNYTLYCGYESKDPYLKTDLIPEDGRTLGIGAVEYLFDAQWQTNHSIKNMKDTLDLASKLVFQTADSKFVGRNVLSAIEVGDVLIHSINNPLTRLANDKPDIAALQNYGNLWTNLGREITATPDSMRGELPPSGTPLGSVQLVTAQSTSLFELMTENKGLGIEDMLRMFAISHLKKQLKNKDEVVGILDAAGIAEIDALYIPTAAVKRFNERTINHILDYVDNSKVGPPQPFNPDLEQQAVKSDLSRLGDKRFFKPDELDEKTWADVFSDFEWDAIRIEVTNENNDKKATFQSLTYMLGIVSAAAQHGRVLSPDEKTVISMILRESGQISPIQLSTIPPPPANPAMVGASGGLPAKINPNG